MFSVLYRAIFVERAHMCAHIPRNAIFIYGNGGIKLYVYLLLSRIMFLSTRIIRLVIKLAISPCSVCILSAFD